ncbi:MAG: hypothetical protein KC503_05385 [Myxococcales bacterium]|nr:hypothetical protein [Myxococcales bacterium]
MMMMAQLFDATRERARDELTVAGFSALFRYMDLRLRLDPSYRRLIHAPRARDADGDIGRHTVVDGGRPDDSWCSRMQLMTRDEKLALCLDIGGGRVRVRRGLVTDADATLVFSDLAHARAMLTESPERVLDMLLEGTLVSRGNLSDVSRLSFMLDALVRRTRLGGSDRPEAPARRAVSLPPPRAAAEPMRRCDAVRYLDDPALAAYSIDDFPRLGRFRHDYFATTPQVCVERPRLYTEAIRRVGFLGVPPIRRQAEAYYHLMTHREPLVRDGDLLAGTTTSKPIGVVVYPECGGVPIWPELQSVSRRRLNPYRIAPEDARVLNDEVFPYWMDRNVREVARARYDDPRWLQLDERWVLYFQWKTQAVSHTIADYPTVLSRGLRAIADDARARAAQRHDDGHDSAEGDDGHESAEGDEAREVYAAMARCIDGVLLYAAALSRHAAALAAAEPHAARRAELVEMSRICAKVPAEPAETLHEALQAMWIVWIACHMESTNAGLSIGRLDAWLQPYFEADMARIPAEDAAARARAIERAVELVGCFYLRCADHLPQVADLGNKLFGGSASGQVICLGGVDARGANAVADMTYICLKVTEMLGLKDPNVNARYHEGVNSPDYLRRLCEVNLLTGATPSIHNDQRVIDVLVDQNMTLEHARDWSATGCVEPTSCGRHYGHTNCMMFNLVAPLEMALRDGYHPLLGEHVGPRTGAAADLTRFEQLREAYFAQLRWQIETATHANNMLGLTHQLVRPTPLLSALIDGPMDAGVDLSAGGARYNSSGSGNVGLVDVVDSLVALETLVYDERRLDLATFVAALDADFVGHEALLARIQNRVSKLGSGDRRALAIAADVVRFCHETFRAQPHYRGGHYNSGFWSMSNHVAFGVLSGALPSGRRRGKAFTPGLTPAPLRGSGSLLQQIQDVASLDHHAMPNNIAFNVKVVPAPGDAPSRTVQTMQAYARTFVQSGGMQLQFNVVSSDTLRDARAHPERYPALMVRISGYNAYFNDLNDDMKLELIERTEHRIG